MYGKSILHTEIHSITPLYLYLSTAKFLSPLMINFQKREDNFFVGKSKFWAVIEVVYDVIDIVKGL